MIDLLARSKRPPREWSPVTRVEQCHLAEGSHFAQLKSEVLFPGGGNLINL